MKELLYGFLFSANEIFNVGFTTISIVSGICAIVAEIRRYNHIGKGSWFFKLIIFVAMLVVLGTLVKSNLTSVPDVEGHTYENACNILSDYGLKYSLVAEEGTYIVEQNPSKGTIVEKGIKVELRTASIGNNPEVRKKWEYTLNVDFGNIAVSFEEKIIELSNGDETVECIGTPITNYEVLQAYLLEEKSGVEYHEYIIKDGTMIFEHVPKGIEFQLYILLNGYEEETIEVIISSENAVENTFSFNCILTKKDNAMLIPTTFYVANEDGSSIMEVNYMSDVKLWVQWPNDYSWRGDYFTDESGSFSDSIWINVDQTVKVQIIDPFNNGVDYECEVTLYAPRIGEVNPKDIIFINKDGSVKVIANSEYFRW